MYFSLIASSISDDIIAINFDDWSPTMANLIVRNIDEKIVQALKRRAVRNNRSAEAEHRAILEGALIKTRRKPLAQVLVAMPDVGRDKDFERVEHREARDVFD